MIFFTADLHLGHEAILRHQPHRNFITIEEMDSHLIDQVNATVGKNDELWILGDFAWKASKYGHYRQRINCRKIHVVTGNHDSSSLRRHVSSMGDMVVRKFNGTRFHMTHYPMVSWSGSCHGSIHLYGHCHGTLETKLNAMFPGRRSMDVGVDNAYRAFGGFRPVSLDEVLYTIGAV